jgi:hypothetical protein
MADKKGKAPAFLFYSSDFLTGTILFTDEQVGKYMRLLCLQHQQGHLSERDMFKVCGDKDPDIWGKFEQDENGLFYNERLEKETVRRNNYVDSRKKNISGGKNINNTDEENGKHMDADMDNDMAGYMDSHMDADMDIHMENENEIFSNNINIIPPLTPPRGEGDKKEKREKADTAQYEHDFEIIWDIVPKKEGKTAAYKSYKGWIKGKKIDGKTVRLTNAQIYDGVVAYAEKVEGKNEEYIKHGSTVMNNILDYIPDDG